MIKKPGRASDITTFILRVYSVACATLGGAWCFGLASMMWEYPAIFTAEPWYHLVMGILIVSASAYGYFLSNHRISVIVLAPIAVYLISEMIYTPYIRLNRAFGAWEFFAVVQSIYGIFFVAGVAFVVLHLIFVSVKRAKERKASEGRGMNALAVMKQEWKKFQKLHLGFLFLIAGSSVITVGLMNNGFIPSDASITFHPGNYHARFQFYGPSDYTYYNKTQRDSLNALGVRIITGVRDFITYDDYKNDPYMWWFNLTNYKQTANYRDNRQAIINQFTPWKVNATNVTFLYWLHGIPSGLPTDYSVTSGSWGSGALLLNAWLTAEVIVEANLTNVVGFHTDQEGISSNEKPVGGALGQPFQEQRDFERNAQARQNYIEFLHRLRYLEQSNATWLNFTKAMNKSHGIDHLLFTTTYGGPQLFDGLDDDWDMETFTENNVNTVPYDEFLPMLYNQHAFPPDRAHYALYVQMQTLKTTLQKAGHADNIGVLLGCMGAQNSMFEQNYTGTQFVEGSQQAVTGFEIIARQAMIAKAFNCTWISFFPLNPYLPDIWGIYRAYNSSFFDRLNAVVNGPSGSVAFKIRLYPDVTNGEIDLARDVFMSTSWAWFYLAGLIVAIGIASLHSIYMEHRVLPRNASSDEKKFE